MKKFYLIQRGKFRDNIVGNIKLSDGLLSGKQDNLVKPEYMGCSEFENGDLHKSYCTMMQNFDDYIFINLQKEIGLENVNGVPFWAFVHKDAKDDFLESMTAYTNDLKDRTKIREWTTKSWTGIDKHLYRDDLNNSWNRPSSNFWWCIELTNDRTVGDWIMFVGGQDRADAFQKVLYREYTGWWHEQTEEKRKQDYSKRW